MPDKPTTEPSTPPLEGRTDHGATGPSAASRATITLDWSQVFNSFFVALVLAALFGAWKFYDSTRLEMAVLKGDIQEVEKKVGVIYEIVDKAHPRK